MWEVLDDIAKHEKMTANDLCSKIKDRLDEQARRRGPDEATKQVTFSNAVRVFIFRYFYVAATDEGHLAAGHGMGNPFNGTPFADPKEKEDAKKSPPIETPPPSIETPPKRDAVTGAGQTTDQTTLVEPMSEVS